MTAIYPIATARTPADSNSADDINNIGKAIADIVGTSAAPAVALNSKVTGPASVTDGHVAVFDTTGYKLKDGGVPITIMDWTGFTPTGLWTGASSTYTGYYKIIGDELMVRVHIAVNTSPVTSANLVINLPASKTINTTKLLTTSANCQVGYGTFLRDGVGLLLVNVNYESTSAVAVKYHYDNLGGSPYGAIGGYINATTPYTWNNPDKCDIYFSVPIN